MTIFSHPKAVTNMKDSFRAVVYLKYGFEKPISLHRIKVITIMIIVIIIIIIIIIIVIIINFRKVPKKTSAKEPYF